MRRSAGVARRGCGRHELRNGSTPSPSGSATGRAWAQRFLARFDDARHDVYDVPSLAAVSQSHGVTHGRAAIPHYRFDRADVVVSFDADFLGTWLSPVEFTGQYAAARPALHVQVESRFSLTGTKADVRLVASPAESRRLLDVLAAAVGGWPRPTPKAVANADRPAEAARIVALAGRLAAARGRALVVCGIDDVEVQALVNDLNEALGAYGRTIELERRSLQRLGDADAPQRLAEEFDAGGCDLLVVAGVNPVYDRPDGTAWAERLSRVPSLVVITDRLDETAARALAVAASTHPLAAWEDQTPVEGLYCLRQPTTSPPAYTRTPAEWLAAWAGAPADALTLVRGQWRDHVYDPARDGPSFDPFWTRALRAGFVERAVPVPEAITHGRTLRRELAVVPREDGFTLVAYPSVALQDGRQGDNPWLLELPDPLTKVTWDSAASLSPGAARLLEVADGDLVRLSMIERPDVFVDMPVVVQPGQHDAIVAAPLGFGQAATRRFANVGPGWIGRRTRADAPVGANVTPLLTTGLTARVHVRRLGLRRELARTQRHDSQHDVRLHGQHAPPETPVRHVAADSGTAPVATVAPSGRQPLRWGMVIDLDACTGCSACVLACQSENNTPTVGPDEVRRHREMHWLHVDRYVEETPTGVEIAHQPMTCHHCARAPCESVCPVAATGRSADGLNQQIYSRCVGTRYCMNNCPLKVRRFNWFEHARDDALRNLALNPDVTVRSRGVAEKCTFCAHRIQDARLAARRDGRPLADGDVVPACAQSCAARAITFGDLGDPDSRVARAARRPRAYTLLDSLDVRPALHYLAVVRSDARPAPERDDA